ncbi:MAG: FAD-binding oxidoreductase [Candidatus Acidiferrales bacterium]
MSSTHDHASWGVPPWQVDFSPRGSARVSGREADFAIIGGGFTGLAAAAWLRKLAPEKSVVVLEAGRIGAGASGRTGGMALAETAAGDQPGLGDVLAGFRKILGELDVACDLDLSGAWEIARSGAAVTPAIQWSDSGTLRVVKEVPGGTLDPGKLVAGLARAAESRGATLLENHAVEKIEWGERIEISGAWGTLRASRLLQATNAFSLDLAGLGAGMHPRLTLAALTEPLDENVVRAIGLAERKPFYTVDFPYLWGRVRADRPIVWGAGLVSSPDERDLAAVDIASPEAAKMFGSLERRVRGLHPALAEIKFVQRWGGPILFRDSWKPAFVWHPRDRAIASRAVVLAAFAGHGVALTSYLGAWAAEALLGRRDLPQWGTLD